MRVTAPTQVNDRAMRKLICKIIALLQRCDARVPGFTFIRGSLNPLEPFNLRYVIPDGGGDTQLTRSPPGR